MAKELYSKIPIASLLFCVREIYQPGVKSMCFVFKEILIGFRDYSTNFCRARHGRLRGIPWCRHQPIGYT